VACSAAVNEGDGQYEHVTPGVSRRDIAWRAGQPRARRVRIRLAALTLPGWADALIIVLLGGFLVWGAAWPGYQPAEAARLSLVRDAGLLVTRPTALLPGSDATNAVQERMRISNGSFTRYAAAVGWYAAAGRSTPRPIDLGSATIAPSTSTSPPELVPVRTAHLAAARTGPAVLAALSLLMIYLLTRRLAGRPAATVAVLIFGLQPAVLLTGRQVSDSGVTALFGLGAVYVAAGLATRLGAGGDPARGAWMSLAVTSGLCLAAGLAAAPYLAGALAFCLAGLVAGESRRRAALLRGEPVPPPGVLEGLGWVLVTALGAVCVWVAWSPSLWGWLPERLAARREALRWLAGSGLGPDPGPVAWTDALRSVRPLVLGPAPGVLLGAGALLAVAVLIQRIRTGRSARGGAGAVSLLLWLIAVLAWTVAWPSGGPEHLVPLLAAGSVLIGAAVTKGLAAQPGR
jgi:hypothetical protein